jgi:hypothetical protein
MSLDRVRSGLGAKTATLALLAALVCAAAAWTIDAGSALAPEPADLSVPLSGGTGATAAATTSTQQRSTVLLWPAYWQYGPSIAVGTPCSTYGIPIGERPTKRIEGRGNNRRCGTYDPAKPPPANAVRPLPKMPVATGTGTKEASNAVATTVTSIVTVIMWPADWMFSGDESLGPRPEPGQPCSDFELLAGERTYKHIQRKGQDNVDGPFRCVRLQDPIVYTGR